jgi:hypothetical protein
MSSVKIIRWYTVQEKIWHYDEQKVKSSCQRLLIICSFPFQKNYMFIRLCQVLTSTHYTLGRVQYELSHGLSRFRVCNQMNNVLCISRDFDRAWENTSWTKTKSGDWIEVVDSRSIKNVPYGIKWSCWIVSFVNYDLKTNSWSCALHCYVGLGMFQWDYVKKRFIYPMRGWHQMDM